MSAVVALPSKHTFSLGTSPQLDSKHSIVRSISESHTHDNIERAVRFVVRQGLDCAWRASVCIIVQACNRSCDCLAGSRCALCDSDQVMQVVGKNVSSSAAAVAPKTPPQPKERYRSPAVHSKQPEAQPLPAFQRHVMPCMMTAATPATDTASQRPNRMYNPSRQWQSHVPPCRTQQQMQPCSKKHDPVLANVVHQPGCSMMQACSGVGHVAGGRWQPSVQYCLSSAEPAVGAGIWEEQATRSGLQAAVQTLTAFSVCMPVKSS